MFTVIIVPYFQRNKHIKLKKRDRQKSCYKAYLIII